MIYSLIENEIVLSIFGEFLSFILGKRFLSFQKSKNIIYHYFRFEKLFSGLYLGEVVRQILTDMTKLGILFNNNGSQKLFTPWKFQTMYVADIERYVMNLLQHFGIFKNLLIFYY